MVNRITFQYLSVKSDACSVTMKRHALEKEVQSDSVRSHGTLLDTLDDLADSMNAFLRRFGFPPIPVGAYRYMLVS